MIRRIKSIYGFLCRIEEGLSMICLMGATLILCAGAVSRTFGHPLAMINEISLCLFAWCVFLGADAAYRNNKLVYVELIIDGVKPNVRRILYGINYGLIFIFLLFFAAQSGYVVIFSWVRKWSSIPWLSYGWVALSVPIGCFLMLITTGIHFFRYVLKGERKVEQVEGMPAEDGIKEGKEERSCIQ